MANCEPYREQLLDLVYDLLDEEQARTVRAHVADCADCRTALTAAEGQRQTLARAALPVQANVVPMFVRPASVPPAAVAAEHPEPLPASIPIGAPTVAMPAVQRRPARRRYYWLGGAAAAAVLLLAVGACWHEYQQGHRERTEYIARQQEVIRELDLQLASLEPAFKGDVAEAERQVRATEPPHVYVLGPTQLQPRGGDVFQVAVHDLDGKPVDARIKLRLTDQAGKRVLAEQQAVTTHGTASVALGNSGALAFAKNEQSAVLIAQAEVDGVSAEVRQTLALAAPTYVAHLLMNKSSYRPGELLFYRVLLLDQASLTPPPSSVPLQITLVNAQGKTVLTLPAATGPAGVASGELALVPQFADGAYELRVAGLPGRPEVRPHSRKLKLARDGEVQVQADRDQYRAGEVVNMAVQRSLPVPAAAQNTMRNANTVPLSAQILVDGKQVALLPQTMGAGPSATLTPAPPGAAGGPIPNVAPGGRGGFGGGGGVGQPKRDISNGATLEASNASNSNSLTDSLNEPMYFQFTLPNDLEASRVRVRIVLTEGKQQETFEQELSVVPSRLAVDVFPEGGELVAGVPNRVYYRVRSLRGEPVNPEGRVIILSGHDVLLDSAPGAGIGSFTFTPRLGDTYSVRITGPNGALAELPDPFARLGGVRAAGLVLHTPQSVGAENETLTVVLRNAGGPRRVLVVAQCRGHFVGQQWVDAQGTDTPVALGTLPGARGIVRVTAYAADGGTLTPLSERLVYRAPAQRLELSVLHLGAVISPKLGPRNVQFELRARDEHGKPANAYGVLAVVDERQRAREPNPLAHFFIAGDVRTSADLDDVALLAADSPETRQALDLFLGTAGWRRVEPLRGPRVAAAPRQAAFFARDNAPPRLLRTAHEARLAVALAPLQQAFGQQHASLQRDLQAARERVGQGRSELLDFEAKPLEYLRLALGLVTLSLLGLACLLLAVGTWRLVRRASVTPLFASSFACLGLCLLATLFSASLGVPTQPAMPMANRNEMPELPAWLRQAARVASPVDLPIGSLALAEAQAPLLLADNTGPERGRPETDAAAQGVERLAAKRRTAASSDLRSAPSGPPKPHAPALAAANPDGTKAMANRETLQQRFLGVVQRQEQLTRATAQPGQPPALMAGGGAGGPSAKGGKAKRPEVDESTRPGVYANVGSESDTLLWDPNLYLPNGTARLAFDVPPTAGTYQVLFLGHTLDGRLGFYIGRLEVQPDVGR